MEILSRKKKQFRRTFAVLLGTVPFLRNLKGQLDIAKKTGPEMNRSRPIDKITMKAIFQSKLQ